MKGKYKRGKQIKSVADFEKSSALYYRVQFGKSERTKHRSFLVSWQYHTLDCFIARGCVYEAELIDPTENEENNNGEVLAWFRSDRWGLSRLNTPTMTDTQKS